MSKTKINLFTFLENPTGNTFAKGKPPTLEELQPLVIITGGNGSRQSADKLIQELRDKKIEFYVDPLPTERPVKGYPIHLDQIEFIY